MDKKIGNTAAKDFVLDKLVPQLKHSKKTENRPACFGMLLFERWNAKPLLMKLASLLNFIISYFTAFLFFF
jgi:hypothetical protein